MKNRKVALLMSVAMTFTQILSIGMPAVAAEATWEDFAEEVIVEDAEDEYIETVAEDVEVQADVERTEDVTAAELTEEPKADEESEPDAEIIVEAVEEVAPELLLSEEDGEEDGEEEVDSGIHFGFDRQEDEWGNTVIFTDEESFDIYYDEPELEEGERAEILIGTWYEDQFITEPFEEFYTCSDNTITLKNIDGLYECLGLYGSTTLIIKARAIKDDVGADDRYLGDLHIDVMEPEEYPYEDEQYDFYDRQMLPMWDFDFDKYFEVRVQNKDYPFGGFYGAEIEELQFSTEDESKWNEIIDVTEWDTQDGWHVEAKMPGTVLVEAYYSDYNGDRVDTPITFHIYVGGCNYDIWTSTSTGTWRLLPGALLILYPEASIHCWDEENGHYEGDTSGLSFEVENHDEGYITVAPSEDGRSFEIIAAEDVPNCEVSVGVKLFDHGEEVASKDIGFLIDRMYYQMALEEDLEDICSAVPGEFFTITPKLYKYDYEEGTYGDEVDPSFMEQVAFVLDYDTNAFEIYDGEGKTVESDGDWEERIAQGPFTVTRVGDWETDITIHAVDMETMEEYDRIYLWYANPNREIWYENTDMWDPTFCLYPGQEETLVLNTEQVDELGRAYQINWSVGRWTDVQGPEYWETIFVTDYCGDLAVEDGGNTFTVSYEDLADRIELLNQDRPFNDRPDGVHVSAEVIVNGYVVAERSAWVRALESEYEIDYPYDDEISRLPDEGIWIDKGMHAWIRDAEFPDGQHFEFPIINATVENEDEENPAVVFEEENENGWSFSTTENMGSAVITYTYLDEKGNEKDTAFTVYVTGDVYDIWTENVPEVDRMLPGQSIQVKAYGNHNTWIPRWGYFQEELTGAHFDWKILQDSEFVDVEVSENTSEITVTAKEFDTMDNYFAWPEFEVIASLEDEDGNLYEVARTNFGIGVGNCYYSVSPRWLENSRIPVGQSVTIKPEMKLFDAENPEGVAVENVRYRWEFDPNFVEITDADGEVLGYNEDGDYTYTSGSEGPDAEFTLTRLENWGSDVRLIAEVQNEDGDYWEEDSTNYWFDECNYNVRFEYDRRNNNLYTNGDILRINVNSEIENPEIEYLIGPIFPEENPEDEVIDTTFLDEGTDYNITVSEETGKPVIELYGTSIGEKFRAWNEMNEEQQLIPGFWLPDFIIKANVMVKGEVVSDYESTEWINVREPNYDIDGFGSASSLDEFEGRESWTECLVGDALVYEKGLLTMYVEDANYPEGDVLSVNIDHVAVSDPEVLDVVTSEDGTIEVSVLKESTKEDPEYIDLTISCEELGVENCTIRQNIWVTEETYLAELRVDGEDYANLLPGEEVPLEVTLIRRTSTEDGQKTEVVPSRDYMVEYTNYWDELISIENNILRASDAQDEYGNYMNSGTNIRAVISMVVNGEFREVADAWAWVDVSDESIQIKYDKEKAFAAGATITAEDLASELMWRSVECPEEEPQEAEFRFSSRNHSNSCTVAEDGMSVTINADAKRDCFVTLEATLLVQGYDTGWWTERRIDLKVCNHEEENIVTDAAVAATCTATGLTEGKHCSVCGKVLVAQETVNALGHKEEIIPAVAATCTKAGLKEGKRCSVCGVVLVAQEATSLANHTEATKKAVAATCGKDGLTEGKYCSVCGKELVAQKPAKATGKHSFGEYKVTKEATVFAAGSQTHTCTICGTSANDDIAKLVPTIKLSYKTLPLQIKKSVNLNQIIAEIQPGDSIVSCTSSNIKAATVTNTGLVKAGKKKGTTVITVTTKAGATTQITINVQKGAVAATKVALDTYPLTLSKGESFTLKPVIEPITCLQKASFKSSKKAVASVSSKGVIKARKAGSTKITVKVGKKSVKVNVTVN